MSNFCDNCMRLYTAGILEICRNFPIMENCASMPIPYALSERRRRVNVAPLCDSCRKRANELMDDLEAKHSGVFGEMK